MMKDPSIPKAPKMEALGAVLAKLGVNELTTNFFSEPLTPQSAGGRKVVPCVGMSSRSAWNNTWLS